MKTIMFNDKYGLTAAVLSGKKIQTRRNSCRYNVGEVVAIAQSYKDAGVLNFPILDEQTGYHYDIPCIEIAGWNNKMFVKADLMPHHIRITSMSQERLQDISDEDCIKEGIIKSKHYGKFVYGYHVIIDGTSYTCAHYTPREAYASLIDRLNGKGTWSSNQIVWVYDFELLD